MLNKKENKTAGYRFRRWSRKNYASFLSLKKEVTIGRVGSAITEKALLKTNAIFSFFSIFYNAISADNDDEMHDEQNLLLEQVQLFQFNLCNQVEVNAVAILKKKIINS